MHIWMIRGASAGIVGICIFLLAFLGALETACGLRRHLGRTAQAGLWLRMLFENRIIGSELYPKCQEILKNFEKLLLLSVNHARI